MNINLDFKGIYKALIGIFISFILIVFFDQFIIFLTLFCEQYLSTDYYLTPNRVRNIETALFFLITIVTLTSLYMLPYIKGKANNFLNNFINLKNINRFLFVDEIQTWKKLPLVTFISATSLSLFLQYFLVTFGQPTHEGVFERNFSLLLFLSFIILLISSVLVKNIKIAKRTKNQVYILTILVTLLVFFILGEEISWGQRIFGWKAPVIFEKYNFQNETNVHNFFNPLFIFIYPIVGMGLFIGMCLIWFFPSNKESFLKKLFFPHPSLFYLLFTMACATYKGHSEIFEELLSIFIFLYSIRIFICINYPNKNSLNQIQNEPTLNVYNTETGATNN